MCKALQENFEEGIAIGMEKGIEKGVVKGRTAAFTEVAIEMLQEGSTSLEKITQFAKMPLSQVVELKESLEKSALDAIATEGAP